MSEQKSTSVQVIIRSWEQLPSEIRGEFCRLADPATAIVMLFADKSLYCQESIWRNIAARLNLVVTGNPRDVCIKWLKIHRHILQIYGKSDTVTISDWPSYFKNRFKYLGIEQTLRQKYSTFKLPMDYLEWLILGPHFQGYGEHHRSWDWNNWASEPHLFREANSLWLQVATLNDKHEMFINCDTKNKLFGCTVDCYDTALEDQCFDEIWTSWLVVITRDSYTDLWDSESYRRNLFGEKITSFY